MKTIRSIIFYDSTDTSRLRWALHWALNLLYIAAWCLGVGVVSLRFGSMNYGTELFHSYFQYAVLFMLNILPVFAVAAAFFLACNRVWPAVFGSGLIITVLALINRFKLLFRNDPLLVSDVRYFVEAAKISKGYNIVITPAIALTFAVIIGASVFAFFFMNARMRRTGTRLAWGVVLLAACAVLWFGAYVNPNVYKFTSNTTVEFSDGKKLNEWNETDQYCCRGFLYPLLHSGTNAFYGKPDGYSKRETAGLIESRGEGEIPEERKVNFISIMLEAYFDFSEYGDIFSFECDPYEFYHDLQRESYSGELVTNLFAGGTIDTERCYITGSTQLYDYRGAADSYARYFADQGYFTEFCHPGYGWFYNRQNVMEYLGFDSVHFFEDRYTQPEGYNIINDDVFFPDIVRLYREAAAEGRPYFNFSVTYQNHGPYATDYIYDTENEYISGEGLSRESYNILNNYFWGIRLTDDSLREFIDGFRDDSEPVVIVVFGDHKPWLGDYASVYSELGIDISQTDEESFYNYYNTQYLIWANGAAKEALGNDFTGEGGSMSPCFLMTRLMDLCGYEGDAAAQSLRELMDSGVDVVNVSGRFRENGVLTTEPESREELSRVLDIQYYRMHDWARER